jgi:hypothetical protein
MEGRSVRGYGALGLGPGGGRGLRAGEAKRADFFHNIMSISCPPMHVVGCVESGFRQGRGQVWKAGPYCRQQDRHICQD